MASVFENEVIETDSGLILGQTEMEELILVEMRKLQDNRQRAKSSKICNALRKTHGLKEGVVRMSLNYMLKTGKIKDIKHAGRESLKIQEKDFMDEVEVISEQEIQHKDESSNSRNASRDGGRSAVDRDEQQDEDIAVELNGKERKISNDEERIIELRSELKNRAEQEEELMATSDEDDTEDGESLSNYSESDATELTANEEDLPLNEELKTLETDHTANRLDEIERKLERIEARLNEKENEQDSERRNIDRIRVSDEQYVQLMVKTDRLETENKTLKDENYGLKTKILDLQKMLENTGNKSCIENSSQASMMKPQQVSRSQNVLGIPREKQRFTTNNPKRDIQPGTRNDDENSNFKENQDERNQPWEVPTEKNNDQQGIWQLRNDAEISSFKESQIKKSQPWGVPIGKTSSLSEQKEIGTHSQQTIWQFPKRSVKARREIPTQVLSRNRFQILADTKFEEKNCMPTGHMFENESLLRDQTSRTLVGTKTTTPKKRMPNDELFHRSQTKISKNPRPSDNRPGLANQEKRDQHGMQIETTKAQSFGRRKPTVAFIGDSILRGIRKQEINKSVRNYYAVVKTFSGATVEDMESYMVPTLSKKPDGLIIHCGTNNLRSDEPEETAKKIVNVALEASRTVRSVAVSSILARGDSDLMESKRVQVNHLLERSLDNYGIDFIKHENFDENWQELLYDDGIHLNQRGTNVLGGNIVKFLNSA